MPKLGKELNKMKGIQKPLMTKIGQKDYVTQPTGYSNMGMIQPNFPYRSRYN